MNAEQLREVQAPLKAQYREAPTTAMITLSAQGELDDVTVSCRVETGRALVQAGLHPATGGDGSTACSGDLLLQALVACAGVTLKAVATAINVPLQGGRVVAEGDLDFRGTLGMAKDVPVGFSAVRLRFDLESEAPPEQLARLLELTERYCVVYQTLRQPLTIEVTHSARVDSDPPR